jgi:hypothetical protein
MTRPKQDPHDARHEAAHAVVAVRLGLPLAFTSVQRRVLSPGDRTNLSRAPGDVVVSAGYTTLEEGAQERWRAALPSEEARQQLTAATTMAAAGIAADAMVHLPFGHVSHWDDLAAILHRAHVLGIGDSDADPAVRAWGAERVEEAGQILEADDGVAWDRVTAALRRKKRLTVDQVLCIVVGEP